MVLVTDFGFEDLSPIDLWNKALEKYNALELCEQLHDQAAAKAGSDSAESANQVRASALTEAVHALRALGNKEARDR